MIPTTILDAAQSSRIPFILEGVFEPRHCLVLGRLVMYDYAYLLLTQSGKATRLELATDQMTVTASLEHPMPEITGDLFMPPTHTTLQTAEAIGQAMIKELTIEMRYQKRDEKVSYHLQNLRPKPAVGFMAEKYDPSTGFSDPLIRSFKLGNVLGVQLPVRIGK